MIRARQFVSYLLIAGGSFLFFQGVREVTGSLLGQSEAAREFEAQQEAPIPAAAEPSQARRGETVGKLIIPRLGAQLFVLEGVRQEQLSRGPGRLIGSAEPGDSGNCVITGHRDTHFRILKDLARGDDILLETPRGKFIYRVSSTHVVKMDDTEVLQPSSDARLTLITCYPFYFVGPAPKRFVVEARLTAALDTTPAARAAL
jgi:sortase A